MSGVERMSPPDPHSHVQKHAAAYDERNRGNPVLGSHTARVPSDCCFYDSRTNRGADRRQADIVQLGETASGA